MNIVDKVKKQKIKPDVLLLNGPVTEKKTVIVEEVTNFEDKLDSFGIKNVTKKAIEKVRYNNAEIQEKNEKSQRAFAMKQALSMLTELFFPFVVVNYNVLNDICNEYNLIISSLSFYDKAIEEENINELESFKSHLGTIAENMTERVTFPKANNFMFDKNSKHEAIMDVNLANYFNIVAPLSHFDFKGKSIVKIGNEAKPVETKKDMPELKSPRPEPLDPIIIAPFNFGGKVYGVVVTAWDKVADDSRIRTLIK